MSTNDSLALILEAVLFSAGRPLTEQQLLQLFPEEERPTLGGLRQALEELQNKYTESALELVSIASGYQFQSKILYAEWIRRLWEEKPARYSRALLETLALIAYRQPITRGEIEEIRGVSISTSIFKTLQEDREWIRIVGHRDVPGRPALYATTKAFLDYFGLRALDQLPPLPEILALADVDIEQRLSEASDQEKQMLLPELDAEAEAEVDAAIETEIQAEIDTEELNEKELEIET